MGTKFANFHVRNIDPVIIQELLPDCIIRELAKGWTSVLHEEFRIGQIEREARKLSKKIDKAVLSVGYYDDDILVLGVFHQGKSVALHVSSDGYGYEAKMGNPASFQRFLELDEGVASFIKEIFKCEDIEKKITLLEHLFEVPMWINYEIFDQSSEGDLQPEFNKAIVTEYINETKAANKLTNKTKLRLRTELEGMPELNMFKLPNADGDLIMDDPNTYEFDRDGSPVLKKVEANIVEFKNNPVKPILILPDGSKIYSSYGRNKTTIFECGVDGRIIWELEVGFLNVAPVLQNNNIYMKIEINNQSTLVKLSRGGRIEASYPITSLGGRHWTFFLFDNFNRMYYCSDHKNVGNPFTRLYCFDENLEKLAELDIEATSFDALIDNESRLLYLSVFGKGIVVVDLNTMQICKSKKYTEYIEFLFIDHKHNVYLKKGDSTIEIMNSNLDVISRHKLKGQIQRAYINQERVPCFVTWNGQKWDSGKERSTIRLFEVSY